MKKNDFVKHVRTHCKQYGVKVIITNGYFIRDPEDGSMFSGWFDDIQKNIKVAGKNKNFYGILAHEYCHFTQWIEQCPVWHDAHKARSYYKFADFLNGKEIDLTHLDLMRNVEEENERRTVNLIKELKLPIDLKDYIQKANAYLYFYNWMKISKRWSKPNNSPYTNKRLIKSMPDKFQKDYSKLPKKYEKIFREENI